MTQSELKQAGTEPSLEDVFNDPIVQLVLKRDGLRTEEVLEVTDAASARLQAWQRKFAA
jgi:hypothetical protein